MTVGDAGATAPSAEALLHPVIQHHLVNSLGWEDLRPLQRAAIEPVLRGDDALLLAPTAGGKTEAACFPLLTRLAAENWRGLSVLYVCPLKALLNNLEPRLASYSGWLGRRAALWHGDTPASRRRAMAEDPPDLLLTTPESLEAMLVSTLTNARHLFGDVRAVVVDEVHAFAGDDRGWHLLAVLERLSRIAGRPLQRIGLSATVGNPQELLNWLQGSGEGDRKAAVVAPDTETAGRALVQLDYVGSIPNAAKVIASLHQGEKRLVFADSRRSVEALANEMRARGTETFVSHSSLSVDERRRAETAFAESRNCVIVSTSTLELGIDVGDLDRVVQLGAPSTVASFLQRLGRAGRRPGSTRNMLFLATSDQELLRGAGLLRLWSDGYVEPVVAPLRPRHLVAQQLLALCLQEGHVGGRTWVEWLAGLPLATSAEQHEIASWLGAAGYLDTDGGMYFIGPEAERRYGRRHFLELLSVFVSDPQFTVLHGRTEIGTVDPMVLTSKVDGPRLVSLGGRSWRVVHTDWKRRRVHVETSEARGSARWSGVPPPLSYDMADSIRGVLLGAEVGGVELTRRAADQLASARERLSGVVNPGATVVSPAEGAGARWWTWGGGRANSLLATAVSAVCPGLVDDLDRFDNRYLRLAPGASTGAVRAAVVEARARFGTDLAGVQPEVSEQALARMKFAEILPPALARSTLASRSIDPAGAQAVADRPLVEVQAD